MRKLDAEYERLRAEMRKLRRSEKAKPRKPASIEDQVWDATQDTWKNLRQVLDEQTRAKKPLEAAHTQGQSTTALQIELAWAKTKLKEADKEHSSVSTTPRLVV